MVAFDPDEAGRRGAVVAQELLLAGGIECVIAGNLSLPEIFQRKEGEDINEAFGGRK